VAERDVSYDPIVNRFVCSTKTWSYDVSIPSVRFVDRVTVFADHSISGRSTCRQIDTLKEYDKRRNSGKRYPRRICPRMRDSQLEPASYSKKHFQKYIGHRAKLWSG
jgi:hypothetical protein